MKQSKRSKLKTDVIIDPNDIYNEILRQPQLYFEYSETAGDAENEKADLEEKLDTLKAQLDKKFRKKYGDDIKENKIKALLQTHSEVKALKMKILQITKDINILRRAEKTFYQRKEMLELFVYRQGKNMSSGVWSNYMNNETVKNNRSKLVGQLNNEGDE